LSIRHEGARQAVLRENWSFMMRVNATLAIILVAVSGLAGCKSAPTPAAAATPAVEAPPPPAAPAPGVLAGPIGQSLSEKDRETALAAQQEAVASGARKSWRGERGVYGFIAPGAENGACREYTHKIFVNGRPQEAKGQACRQNGEWRVTS
jgi:surface antigen